MGMRWVTYFPHSVLDRNEQNNLTTICYKKGRPQKEPEVYMADVENPPKGK